MKISRPNLIKLIILTVIMALTLLVVSNYKATSKVTWEESRGIPLPFVTLNKYQGPCSSFNICRETNLQTIHFLNGLIDI